MDLREEFIVALHEGGHSVMASFFNRGPVYVCIYPDEADPSVTIGRTDSLTGLEEHEICPRNIHECVMVALAGSMAEILYCGSSGGFDDDVEDALADLRLFNPLANFDDLREHVWECQQILADPIIWGKVLSLAEALYERRELSGVEAQGIVQTCERLEFPEFEPSRLRIASRD